MSSSLFVPQGTELLAHISPQSVRYLHPYYPSRTGKFGDASQRILNFKDGYEEAFDHYFHILNDALPSRGTVTCVPSHAPDNRGAVSRLARKLGGQKDREDGSRCLIRHKEIEKLADGGNRDPTVHLHSVRVEKKDRIENKPVILIDDVVTTGGSMRACTHLLEDTDAEKVYCVSLSRTKY